MKDAWRKNLATQVNKAGERVPINAPYNAEVILAGHGEWEGVLAYDAFACEVVTTGPANWLAVDAPREEENVAHRWTDQDTTRLQSWLFRRELLKLGRADVYSAAEAVAHRNVVHPVRDYLDSLKPDGKSGLLDNWLSMYLGVKADNYSRMVGRSILVSAVGRIYKPGEKVDTAGILEGPQGKGKSRALRVLFSPQWHSDTPIDLDSKDRFTALRGVWCLEWAELDSLKRAREQERVKAFMSSASDRFRPPYGRADVVAPRQCIFIGTTNRDDYLSDETGNRRFFPVRVGDIDLEALERDRDQLWAEAVVAYRDGFEWWPSGLDVGLATVEQAARVQADVWETDVATWIGTRSEVSIGDVLGMCLGIELGKRTQADQNRVARVLSALGFERFRGKADENGKRPWIYRRPTPSTLSQSEGSERESGTEPKSSVVPVCPSVPLWEKSTTGYRGEQYRKLGGQTRTTGTAGQSDPRHEEVASLFGGPIEAPGAMWAANSSEYFTPGRDGK